MSDPPPTEARTLPVRTAEFDHRGLASRALLASVLAPGALCALASAIGSHGALVHLLQFSSMVSPLALIVAAIVLVAPRRWHNATAEVGPDALVVRHGRRTLRVPTERVASAFDVPALNGSVLRIRAQNGTRLDLRLADPADGGTLLALARLGPTQRRAQLHMGRVFPRLLYYLLGAPFVAWGTFTLAQLALNLVSNVAGSGQPYSLSVGAFGACAALAVWLGTRVARATFVVGADGVRIARGLGERFYPFRDVERVELQRGGLVFTLRGGEQVREWCDGDLGAEPGEVFLRVQAAHAAAARGGEVEGEARAALLDRGGRSLADWRAALRDLVGEAKAYRQSALGRDELLAVLADARASLERRLGAALALRARGDADASERVRAAAAASADERVRVVLESVADGREDEAVRAQAQDGGAAGRMD